VSGLLKLISSLVLPILFLVIDSYVLCVSTAFAPFVSSGDRRHGPM